MRSLFYLSLLLLTAYVAQAQKPVFGNEWINYQQTYYKIPVAQKGLYRVTFSDLQKAGLPLATLNPKAIQLFHRGVEQAILVEGETDGKFDATDYIEFIGRGNDGTQDSALYRPASAQPHPYYSLYSDTTAYFLTARLDAQPGKRMATYTDTDAGTLTPEPYHWEEELRLFTDTYPGWASGIPSKIEYSHYEAGEGYTGPVQQNDRFYDNAFALVKPIRTGPAPQLDVLMVGRDNFSHRVECLVGAATDARRLLSTVAFPAFDNARLQENLAWVDVANDGRLVVSTRGEVGSAERYSVSYIRLRYPQKLTANGQVYKSYQLLPNSRQRSLLDVTDLPANTRFWDITDLNAPIQVGVVAASGTSARLVVQRTDQARLLVSASQPIGGLTINKVQFTAWENRRPTYLIVTHEALMKPAGGVPNAVNAYAAYRASNAGGRYDTLTVTMQQLIDQFSYGERHPMAITRFANQFLQRSKGVDPKPHYLLLIGQSRSTPGIRRNPRQATLDMVITYGFPGSDVVFTAGLAGQAPNVPAIPTGRINAGTPQEVMNYLQKVQQFEGQPVSTPWRKNFLHLSGGASLYETTLFKSLVDKYRDMAVAEPLGARVTTLSKKTDDPVEQINVAKQVNEGVGVITFFGHSSLDLTDLDIGLCSNETLGYQNQGKYPLLLINGCASGNFFFGRPTLSSDWVLTPNRGAIAVIAQSHLGYVSQLNRYTTNFYSLLTDSTQLSKSIGQIQQETIRRVLTEAPDGWDLANTQQMVLQGDPAVRLFPFSAADFAVGSLSVLPADNKPLTVVSDSVRVDIAVRNFGQYHPGKLPVQVRRFVDNREIGVFNFVLPKTVAYSDTLTLTIPNDRQSEGRNQFEVTINPKGILPESDLTNNRATAEVYVAGQGPVLIYPPQGASVGSRTVRLTAESFVVGTKTYELELDTTSRFTSSTRLMQRVSADSRISYLTTLPYSASGGYFWRVREAVQGAEVQKLWSVGSFSYALNSPAQGLPEGQVRLVSPLPSVIYQGDVVNVPVQFANLSPYPFADSLTVRRTIYAAGLTSPQTTQWRVKAPVGGDTLQFVTRIATENLPGLNRLVLTVNPRLLPESSFINNTLDLALPVLPDQNGPVLEVAFDGIRLTNGAIVAAKPVIDLLVADDNRALIRRDTTGLSMYLQGPGTAAGFQRLSWRTAKTQTTGTNDFRIQYSPPTLTEGEYKFLVTATDLLGNAATPYQVVFRVSKTQELSGLTVYPNPAVDNVFFVYQLTGAQAPDQVSLTIYALTGRLVRQLTADPNQRTPRIGKNNWQWDGRSTSGELMPAGVYIYTLQVGEGTGGWPVADAVKKRLTGRFILTR